VVKTRQDNQEQTGLARELAPEDIQRGMYVTPLYRVDEFMPGFSVDEAKRGGVKPLQVRWLPYDGGEPLKVLEVCLPFVLVNDRDGDRQTIDTRQVHLAQLSERYGWRAQKRKPRKTGKGRRKRKSSCED